MNKVGFEEITPFFVRSEFDCPCGCKTDFGVDIGLVSVLHDVRKHFNSPLIITTKGGGYRCPDYNKQCGGAPNSYHLRGMAADFYLKGLDIQDIANYLEMKHPHSLGIGVASNWMHVDSRSSRGRWTY